MFWSYLAFAPVPTPGGPGAITELPSLLPMLRAASAYEGFGAATPAGGSGTIVHVTNLKDSGPGSFRDAVSRGNRTVVFDVAGKIALKAPVYVTGAFITIDGFTAPSPGITLKGNGLYIRGNRGAHNITVRGIRVRDAAEDGIQIAWNAYNIVVDHVSVSGSGDGNIDITHGARDVTVSWTLLGPLPSDKNMLIGYNASRITLHHNAFVNSKGRNPYISNNYEGTAAPDTTVDMRNNVVWGWGGGFGTVVWFGAKANVVNNFYSSNGGEWSDALIACTGGSQSECLAAYPSSYAWARVDGNMSAEGPFPGDFSNLSAARPAPFVDTVEACTAAYQVAANGGVRPLDSIDRKYLSSVKLPPCLGVAPGRLNFYATAGGANPVAKKLSITGLGGTDYVWTAVVSGGSWLSIDQPAGATPSRISVAANLAGVAAGTYAGAVIIAGGGAPNSPIIVPVKLVVGEKGDPTPGPASDADLFVVSHSLTAPARAGRRSAIKITDATKNQGDGAAGASTTRYYLSTDNILDPADILLGGREVPALGSHEKSDGTTKVRIPRNIERRRTYYLIATADDDNVVGETAETNNRTHTTIYIR